MGVNVAAHTRHIFLGSAPPPPDAETLTVDLCASVHWQMNYELLHDM